jgi:hypothetical protein
MMSATGFFIYSFYEVEVHSFHFGFHQGFYQESSEAFSASVEMIM